MKEMNSSVALHSCSTASSECCNDSDCTKMGKEVCIEAMCFRDGSLRFSLYWVGKDILSLTVMTPTWQTLSSAYTVAESPNFAWESNDHSKVHVRNLVFSGQTIPAGNYIYSIGSSSEAGSSIEWSVGVYIQGKEASFHTGQGLTSFLVFEYPE